MVLQSYSNPKAKDRVKAHTITRMWGVIHHQVPMIVHPGGKYIKKTILKARFILQTSRIWGGTSDDTDLVKPGTMLIRSDDLAMPQKHIEQPVNWTNYRFSCFLKSTDNHAIGIIFRYQDLNNCYRFSMDNEQKYRRLVKIFNGVVTRLVEDHFGYIRNQDYLITIEVFGSSLRLYQDDLLIFDVTDNSITNGTIGMYSWNNSGARFTDVRIDDFRAEAPVVYRFKFTTSNFSNFFHLMHSYQDETWIAAVAAQTDTSTISNLIDQAVDTSMPTITVPPSESEAHSYAPPKECYKRKQLKFKSQRLFAFLFQSPEPIDWKRISLEVQINHRPALFPELPNSLKLTNVSFSTSSPDDDSVTLLLREAVSLTSLRIEYRRLPGPVPDPISNPILLSDNFDNTTMTDPSGHIGQWYVVDEAAGRTSSTWGITGGALTQTTNVDDSEAPDYPGTYVLAGLM